VLPSWQRAAESASSVAPADAPERLEPLRGLLESSILARYWGSGRWHPLCDPSATVSRRAIARRAIVVDPVDEVESMSRRLTANDIREEEETRRSRRSSETK